jgi:hypothetical protein
MNVIVSKDLVGSWISFECFHYPYSRILLDYYKLKNKYYGLCLTNPGAAQVTFLQIDKGLVEFDKDGKNLLYKAFKVVFGDEDYPDGQNNIIKFYNQNF